MNKPEQTRYPSQTLYVPVAHVATVGRAKEAAARAGVSLSQYVWDAVAARVARERGEE